MEEDKFKCLEKYFPKAEFQELNTFHKQRYLNLKNIYEEMTKLELDPALPEFMEPKNRKPLEEPAQENSSSTDISDEESSCETEKSEKNKAVPSADLKNVKDKREGKLKIRRRCTLCDYSTYHGGNLKTHMITHTKEKPFKCDHCDKSFNNKSNLKAHELIHKDEKPFKCAHCEKAFKQKTNLIAHERVHTGDKPFRCVYCDKTFSQKSNLTVHKRFHTQKPKTEDHSSITYQIGNS